MTQMAEKRDNQIEINTNLNMDNNKNYNTILNGKAKNLDKNSRNSFKTNSKKNEESNLDLNSHRIITDEEIKNAPEIFLEEVMGEMLKNNKLLINAAGLTTGLRKARDGLVFFGFSSKNLKNVLKNLIISRDVNLLLMMLN
jgi:argonaute-like protein implicated in RNA metabolism and viral defense